MIMCVRRRRVERIVAGGGHQQTVFGEEAELCFDMVSMAKNQMHVAGLVDMVCLALYAVALMGSSSAAFPRFTHFELDFVIAIFRYPDLIFD